MKPFGKKRDHPLDLPASGLTGRQLTAIAIAFALAIVLVPVGARAAQIVSAIITDPGGVNKATVDAGGNLHVAGNVTVDSSTPVAVATEDPARMAFQTFKSLDINGGEFSASLQIDVPEGMRLVITHASGQVSLPTGEKLIVVGLQADAPAGDTALHRLIPVYTGTTNSGRDSFTFTQDGLMFADGRVFFAVQRDDDTNPGDAFVSVSGYLIDCSGDSCN